jgi:hypothetical protein
MKSGYPSRLGCFGFGIKQTVRGHVIPASRCQKDARSPIYIRERALSHKVTLQKSVEAILPSDSLDSQPLKHVAGRYVIGVRDSNENLRAVIVQAYRRSVRNLCLQLLYFRITSSYFQAMIMSDFIYFVRVFRLQFRFLFGKLMGRASLQIHIFGIKRHRLFLCVKICLFKPQNYLEAFSVRVLFLKALRKLGDFCDSETNSRSVKVHSGLPSRNQRLTPQGRSGRVDLQ